jgi:hypothetical protein
MDDVLDVVQDDDGKRVVAFHALHLGPHLIQILAFGRGAVALVDDDANAGKPAGHRFGFLHGQRIVGIDADEDVVLRVLDGARGELHHPFDDIVLVPTRYEDGNPLLAFRA